MINLPYVSLHNQTTFSTMDALVSVQELCELAKKMGHEAVAITDHGTLASMWDAYKIGKKMGIKVIPGCEFNFVESVDNDEPLRHIILLAKNATGYHNLLLLNKLGFDNKAIMFKSAIPRIDWKLLEDHSDGLICTTACGNGIISQLIMQKKHDEAKESLKRLKDIFGDDLAIELQAHALVRKETAYSGAIDQRFINLNLKKLSEELGIRAIVTTNTHYADKDDYRAHDTLLAIRSGQTVFSGNRLKYNVNDFYYKHQLELASFFVRLRGLYPQSFVESLFENTVYFANKCEDPEWIDLKYSNPTGKELPKFPVRDEPNLDAFDAWAKNNAPGLDDDVAYLRYRCDLGLKKMIPESKHDEYKARLKEEFDVIEYHGFSSYMLIVADFINYARKNGIRVGPGRGSVAGSLIAYLLEIHVADPIKYGLIFARFHNKEKTSFPDIDVDFAPSGRDEVQNYIRQKYGEDYVAHVSNVNTITPKVYVKDIARAHEFGGDRKEAVKIGNEIADFMPSGPSAPKSLEKAKEEYALFAEAMVQFPELAEFADKIGGKPRAWSTHAGGLIIGARPLPGLVPVRRDVHDSTAIEYDKDKAEEIGLVKMDTLGLETLDIITDTYKLIKAVGKDVPPDPPRFDEYDKETYDLISSGDTLCIFQLSGIASTLCQSIKPNSIEEISYINALVRPSAKAIVKDFIATREGKKKVELLDSSLERAFGETYGFGLYEECLLYLAQDVAGWDLHSADRLRKLTKEKGKNPKKVAGWREEFINDGKSQGIDEHIVTKIWDEVVNGFQGYGFNKSLYSLQKVDTFTKDGQFLTSKAIKYISSNEYVRSRDEKTGVDIYVRVIDNHDHGKLEVVDIELETGEKVRCTMNHKFRTVETGDMVPLHQIIENDYSIVVK